MRNQRLIAIAGVLCALAAPVVMGAVIDHRANEVVAVGADPMLAIERNRSGIIERLVVEHRSALFANGIAESAFRNALWSLRADQLLAASLVHTLEEVSAIVAAPPTASDALSRYVAVAPTVTLAALPAAEAYLVREGESLKVVHAAQLQLNANIQLVGYFVAGSSGTVVAVGSGSGIAPKDGPGSGANSWIGYTGGNNVASGSGSAVAAGTFNAATGASSMVLGGSNNSANGISSLVIGGFDNHATVIDAMVGAGAGNRATGARSVVVGGGYNLASGQWSFVGGGGREFVNGAPAGGYQEDNVASGDFSVVTGGQGNRATGRKSFVGGGHDNTASDGSSTVSGGAWNRSTNFFSTVAGGREGHATEISSTVGGGGYNTASGIYSTVPGGYFNRASGWGTFAVGKEANADNDNCFMFAGWSAFGVQNTCGAPNVARFLLDHGMSVEYFAPVVTGGGARWVYVGDFQPGRTIVAWNNAYLSDTGVWQNSSDRALKDGFVGVDAGDVLAKVVALPIARWHYLQDGPAITHIGPTAQNFRASFGLGQDDKTIGTIDADGVALVAIKGLNAKLEAETVAQRREIAELRERLVRAELIQLDMAALKAALAELQRERATVAVR